MAPAYQDREIQEMLMNFAIRQAHLYIRRSFHILLPSNLLIDPTKPEFQSRQLKVASVLRLHKFATIHCSSLERHLGPFDSAQHVLVAAKVRELLRL
jgi:hypothetical protein